VPSLDAAELFPLTARIPTYRKGKNASFTMPEGK